MASAGSSPLRVDDIDSDDDAVLVDDTGHDTVSSHSHDSCDYEGGLVLHSMGLEVGGVQQSQGHSNIDLDVEPSEVANMDTFIGTTSEDMSGSDPEGIL